MTENVAIRPINPAKGSKLVIELSLTSEPSVSEIYCKAVDCVFNMALTPVGLATCNLKHLTINPKGQCSDYRPVSKGVVYE